MAARAPASRSVTGRSASSFSLALRVHFSCVLPLHSPPLSRLCLASPYSCRFPDSCSPTSSLLRFPLRRPLSFSPFHNQPPPPAPPTLTNPPLPPSLDLPVSCLLAAPRRVRVSGFVRCRGAGVGFCVEWCRLRPSSLTTAVCVPLRKCVCVCLWCT